MDGRKEGRKEGKKEEKLEERKKKRRKGERVGGREEGRKERKIRVKRSSLQSEKETTCRIQSSEYCCFPKQEKNIFKANQIPLSIKKVMLFF